MAINSNQLADEIARQLQRYGRALKTDIQTLAKDVAKEGATDLKRLSRPKRPRGGDYLKGWRAKKVKGIWVIHNKDRYQLTHLLEKGHVKKGGVGRTVSLGRVGAIPHIAPVEQDVIRKFTQGVERLARQ